MARTVTVELTGPQLDAVCGALDTLLMAGTAEECDQVFGSPQGTKAAANAHDKLVAAGNRIGWWGRRPRGVRPSRAC